jgi:endoglucanase
MLRTHRSQPARGRRLAWIAFFAGSPAASVMSGCITGGPAEYGASPDARDLHLELCPDGMIEDGEDNNTQINVVGDRGGYWFAIKDDLGSTLDPEGDFHLSEGGPEGSRYAAHIKGHVAVAGQNVYPYVGMGFNLSNPKSPLNAGEARGIQFWAKGPGKVRFKVPDIMTDPVGDLCTSCYNDFGVDIFFGDTWQRYTVPFAKMEQQPGWGDRAPRISKDKLFAVQWQFGTPDQDYDIWVDNVAFVGCEP